MEKVVRFGCSASSSDSEEGGGGGWIFSSYFILTKMVAKHLSNFQIQQTIFKPTEFPLQRVSNSFGMTN